MPVEKLPDPILITRPPALHRLVRELLREPIVAVDTESNSLYAYQEQVCLVQFSTPQVDFLVDPLALDDLSPLGKVFADEEIEKVFHAAEYDVICLKRDFGFEFNNLFDTMVAARILGRKAVGLGSLLEDSFGVQLNKRFQRANWGARPLSAELMSYARLDTHYLIQLRDRLMAELLEDNLWELAQEDFSRLTQINGRNNGNDGSSCWRVTGAYDLHPQKASVLQQLCDYRDQVARRKNRPLFKVMGDKTLISIANNLPENREQLKEIPGMNQRQIEKHGEEVLKAIQQGLKGKPLSPPRNPRPADDFLERLDQLKDWRKHTARKLGVESDVVLPKDLLLSIAEHNPHCQSDLAELLESTPWRLEHYGEQILQVLQ